jgi:hypothetical protein
MNFVAIPACYLHFYLPVFSPRKSATRSQGQGPGQRVHPAEQGNQVPGQVVSQRLDGRRGGRGMGI